MVGKIRAIAAELGWLNMVLYGLDRMFSKSGGGLRIFRYVFFAQPVPETPPAIIKTRAETRRR